MDFHTADLSFIKDNHGDKSLIYWNIDTAENPVKQALITVVFALLLGYTEIVDIAKKYILDNIPKQAFKTIITECRNNPKIIERLTSICSGLTKGE
jgi:hypothetical protein